MSIGDFETTAVFCKICGREVERFADVVASMLAMPELLAEAQEAAGEAAGGPEEWSAREVLAHLADTEVFRGFRIRLILSEDDPLIQGFDEEAWAQVFHYDRREMATSLATFSVNRLSSLELVRLAGGESLERPWRHAVRGAMTLADLVHHTSDHDLGHLRQMGGERLVDSG